MRSFSSPPSSPSRWPLGTGHSFFSMVQDLTSLFSSCSVPRRESRSWVSFCSSSSWAWRSCGSEDRMPIVPGLEPRPSSSLPAGGRRGTGRGWTYCVHGGRQLLDEGRQALRSLPAILKKADRRQRAKQSRETKMRCEPSAGTGGLRTPGHLRQGSILVGSRHP